MKKNLKIIVCILIAFFIIFLFFVLYQKKIENNLRKKEILVVNEWRSLYNNIEERNIFLNSLCQNFMNNKIMEPLCLELNKNKDEREIYQDACDLTFVKLEYDLNKKYLIYKDEYLKNISLQDSSINLILSNIDIKNIELNRIANNYNDYTINYHKYMLGFPNIWIAKTKGFYRKKFFTIKFGIENEDPMEREDRIQKWVQEGGDFPS